MNEPVYLDHAATTPVDPRVVEAMLPYFGQRYGNASSRQHAAGREAAAAVEQAREAVARLLGADPREVYFTSGATESNNLVLKGVAGADAYARKPRRFVTARTEHHAVLDPLQRLEDEAGFAVARLAVDGVGAIDLDELRAVIGEGCRLVTLMHANNELGTLHPLADVGALCREAGVLFHTDAAQSFGKEPLDVETMCVDALSLSGHKLYGPKGVGAVYLRRRRPRVRCRPLVDGGGHERGVRSGTLNVPAIVGLGVAAELCRQERVEEQARLRALRDAFEAGLAERVGGVQVNGHPQRRLAALSNVSFDGVRAESLLARLDGVQASSAAACTSAARQPSHVLRAVGAGEQRVEGSVRFSLGRATTAAQVARALGELEAAVAAERRDGPLDLCAAGASG